MGTPPIPVTVIGGYLGAGKTTLVNRLLREPAGERLAVLVNDFGAVGIDAELIEAFDGRTMSLTNGCICCSLVDGFAEVLTELRDGDRPPDRVVVETSGVADPRAVAQWAHLPGFRLGRVVALADAGAVRRQAADRYVGRHVVRQLAGADVIVLNKVDRVDPPRLVALRDWLATAAPGVPVAEAERAAVPRAVVVADAPAAAVPAPAPDAVEHRQWTFLTTEPVDPAVLHELLSRAPRAVVRAKGIVSDGSASVVVQLAGGEPALESCPPSTRPGSRLVVVAGPAADDERLGPWLAALRSHFPSPDDEVPA